MSTISFPSNPSLNQTYAFGGKTWVYNGAAWQLQSTGSINDVPIGNITPSTGAFTTLSTTGNATIANASVSGNITTSGNISGTYIIGNGSQLTGLPAGYTNTNVTDLLASGNVTANITTSGNVSGNYFLGNGSQLTGIDMPVTTVSNTAPVGAAQGDIWVDTDTGVQYLYITTNGNSQWVETEAANSFEIASYGNADVAAYLPTYTGNITAGNITSGNILPSANVTYDLGSSTARWNDIWLANSTIYLGEANISASGIAVVLPANTTVGGATIVASPLISAIDYPGDDTAADPAGGQTISIEGANFQSGAAVYVDGGLVGVVSFISSSVLQFVSPAKSAGSYSLYVVNPNGATAIAVPGIQYSGTPTWSTAAGNIGQAYETTAFVTTVVATGDAPISYSVAAGNSLPTDMALTTANGYLSVATVPVTNNDTTYNFNIVATDAEQQDTPRQFSVTYKTDVVTWSSPANASSYTWTDGTANSVSMSATSAAGKAVSFAVQAGSLPSNVTIAGNLISGTPNVLQSNTSVTVRATAATTNRYADQTFYFTVVSGNLNRGLFVGGVRGSYTNAMDYVTITTLGNAADFGDMTQAQGGRGTCASSTRGIMAGGVGVSPGNTNVIDYVTIATAGDATDFGDLVATAAWLGGCSSQTRGVFAGGGPDFVQTNVIQYITIATTGNTTDFGDLNRNDKGIGGCGSPTRGVYAGTWGSSLSIQYITIASVGNSSNFGDLITQMNAASACSSSVRGLFSGQSTNTIEYITIASTGNATDFGDLWVAGGYQGCCSSDVRGLWAGDSSGTNVIQYVTIASTGNTTDFGDLVAVTSQLSGLSSCHGGLQ